MQVLRLQLENVSAICPFAPIADTCRIQSLNPLNPIETDSWHDRHSVHVQALLTLLHSYTLLIRMPNRPPIRKASATVADPGSGNAQSSTVMGLGGDAMAVTAADADVAIATGIAEVIVALTAARTRHCSSNASLQFTTGRRR